MNMEGQNANNAGLLDSVSPRVSEDVSNTSTPRQSTAESLLLKLQQEMPSTMKIDETGITVALNMFVAPINHMALKANRNIPLQTERVSTRSRRYIFSPATWCDPLRPYRFRYVVPAGPNNVPPAQNRDHSQISIAHTHVQVGYVKRDEQHIPQLSSLATTIKTIISSDALHSYQPHRLIMDIPFLAAIVERLPPRPAHYYDEAPLVRCLLLMHVMAPANYFLCHSSIVQATFMNICPSAVPLCTWSALPADDVAGRQSPALAPGTVRTVAMTTDVYSSWLCGHNVNINNDWVGIGPDQVVTIPVRSKWTSKEWLLGYIVCFLSTGWWNFSRTVHFQNLKERLMDAGNDLEHTSLQCLVEACTVELLGAYSYVVLVIIDRVAQDYSANSMFLIRQTPALNVPILGSVNNSNYQNLSTDIYNWLGRMATPNNPASMSTYLTVVWRHLNEMIALPGMADRAMTMTSELCYRRRISGRLNPGNLAAGERRFVGAYGLGVNGAVWDGCQLVNWAALPEAQAQILERAIATLSHSPLGLYPNCATYTGSGANHIDNIPSYNTNRYISIQYCVNQATSVARLAIANGLLVRAESEVIGPSHNDVLMRCQGTAALLLGIGGWIHCATGLSAGMLSNWPSHYLPQWYHSVMPTATDNFVVPSMSGNGAGVSQEMDPAADYSLQALLTRIDGVDNVIVRENVIAVGQMNVPWWYVSAIMDKFGFSYETKCRRTLSRVAFKGMKNMQLAYRFNEASQWTDVHCVSGDLSYEDRHWFTCRRVTFDGGMVEGQINFWPDHYIDGSRSSIASGTFKALPLPKWGVLNTTITFTTTRLQPEDEPWQTVILWGDLPVDEYTMIRVPNVLGKLQYPGLIADWIWKGEKRVIN